MLGATVSMDLGWAQVILTQLQLRPSCFHVPVFSVMYACGQTLSDQLMAAVQNIRCHWEVFLIPKKPMSILSKQWFDCTTEQGETRSLTHGLAKIRCSDTQIELRKRSGVGTRGERPAYLTYEYTPRVMCTCEAHASHSPTMTLPMPLLTFRGTDKNILLTGLSHMYRSILPNDSLFRAKLFPRVCQDRVHRSRWGR